MKTNRCVTAECHHKTTDMCHHQVLIAELKTNWELWQEMLQKLPQAHFPGQTGVFAHRETSAHAMAACKQLRVPPAWARAPLSPLQGYSTPLINLQQDSSPLRGMIQHKTLKKYISVLKHISSRINSRSGECIASLGQTQPLLAAARC